MGQASRLKACLFVGIIIGALQYFSKLREIASLASNEGELSIPFSEDSFRQKGVLQAVSRDTLGPIFYNVFIPHNDTEKQENSLRIVREQMQQRAWSDPSSPVWYTLVGSPKLIFDFCRPNCHQREYLKNGDEVNTLQALYEYCRNHPKELVTYIHDKGSFHHTQHNEQTRRTATKAALECRTEMSKLHDLSPYNVCTGTLIILPQYLSKANMWSAKCSYVRNLVPPKDYGSAMERMYNETLYHPQLGPAKYACLRPIHFSDNHLGLGRYAYERWVWSHPDLIPADVIPYRKINFTSFPPAWKPSLARSLKGSPRRMHLHKGFGDSSFARLEGRLLEWDFLYHKQPENSSWIWSYYKGYETGSPAFKIRYCPPNS
jgi:hypothetical protein